MRGGSRRGARPKPSQDVVTQFAARPEVIAAKREWLCNKDKTDRSYRIGECEREIV